MDALLSKPLPDCTPVLTDETRRAICQWHGQFMRPKDMQERLIQEFGIKVDRSRFYQFLYQKKWRAIIDQYRAEWVKGVMENPIAHQRGRLDRLLNLLEDSEEEYAEIRGADSRRRQRSHMLAILEQARLEMEERRTDVTNLYLTQINQEMTPEELLKKRDELVSKIQHIKLGGAHGRLGRSEGGTQASRDPAEDGGGNGTQRDDAGEVVSASP